MIEPTDFSALLLAGQEEMWAVLTGLGAVRRERAGPRRLAPRRAAAPYRDSFSCGRGCENAGPGGGAGTGGRGCRECGPPRAALPGSSRSRSRGLPGDISGFFEKNPPPPGGERFSRTDFPEHSWAFPPRAESGLPPRPDDAPASRAAGEGAAALSAPESAAYPGAGPGVFRQADAARALSDALELDAMRYDRHMPAMF